MQQWARTDTGYMGVGPTEATLPPGVYRICPTPNGMVFQPAPICSDKIVLLKDSPAYQVIRNIRKFWLASAKFEALGLVHKRGALLHGTPGSGKTAAIVMLAKEVVKDGGIVLLAGQSPHGLGSGLKTIRAIESKRPIVCVLEDVETMLSWEEMLLSLLDGEDQVDHVCFLATTNHIEKLPKRLMDRPSRFDDVVNVGNPDAATREAYLRSRVGPEMLPDAELAHWVSQTEGFTIAYLKEVVVAVLALDQSLEAAIARLRGMRKDAAEIVPISGKRRRVA